MRFKALAILHNRVIHNNVGLCSESDIELEHKWILTYPYDLLKHVCVDCFSDPDSEMTSEYVGE